MLYSLFLSGVADTKLSPTRNGEGGQMGKSTYAMGIAVSVHVRTMGGEWVNFLPFWYVRTS